MLPKLVCSTDLLICCRELNIYLSICFIVLAHESISHKHVYYTLSRTRPLKHWLFFFCVSPRQDWCPRGRRECGGVRRQLVPAALLWQRRRAVQGVGQTDSAGGQTAACRTAGRPPRRHHLHPQQGGGGEGRKREEYCGCFINLSMKCSSRVEFVLCI